MNHETQFPLKPTTLLLTALTSSLLFTGCSSDSSNTTNQDVVQASAPNVQLSAEYYVTQSGTLTITPNIVLASERSIAEVQWQVIDGPELALTTEDEGVLTLAAPTADADIQARLSFEITDSEGESTIRETTVNITEGLFGPLTQSVTMNLSAPSRQWALGNFNSVGEGLELVILTTNEGGNNTLQTIALPRSQPIESLSSVDVGNATQISAVNTTDNGLQSVLAYNGENIEDNPIVVTNPGTDASTSSPINVAELPITGAYAIEAVELLDNERQELRFASLNDQTIRFEYACVLAPLDNDEIDCAAQQIFTPQEIVFSLDEVATDYSIIDIDQDGRVELLVDRFESTEEEVPNFNYATDIYQQTDDLQFELSTALASSEREQLISLDYNRDGLMDFIYSIDGQYYYQQQQQDNVLSFAEAVEISGEFCNSGGFGLVATFVSDEEAQFICEAGEIITMSGSDVALQFETTSEFEPNVRIRQLLDVNGDRVFDLWLQNDTSNSFAFGTASGIANESSFTFDLANDSQRLLVFDLDGDGDADKLTLDFQDEQTIVTVQLNNLIVNQ